MSKSAFEAPVTAQPMNFGSMDLYKDYHLVSTDGKQEYHQHEHSLSRCNHGNCEHSQRSQRTSPLCYIYLATAIISCLALVAVLAYTCLDPGTLFELGMGGLAKRATGDGAQNGPLVNRKLYLIIIFVGLLVVVILAVMLSAWCCKGAFQNPLCCPCYLCACCGGLACLECIGCGLCAEGMDQV